MLSDWPASKETLISLEIVDKHVGLALFVILYLNVVVVTPSNPVTIVFLLVGEAIVAVPVSLVHSTSSVSGLNALPKSKICDGAVQNGITGAPLIEPEADETAPVGALTVICTVADPETQVDETVHLKI